MENKDNTKREHDTRNPCESTGETGQRLWDVAESTEYGRERYIQNNSTECGNNEGIDFGNGSNINIMAQSSAIGRRGRSDGDTTGDGGEVQVERRGATGELADAHCNGITQRKYEKENRTREAIRVRSSIDIDYGGTTNGFWRDAEWIQCTDGKARPVGIGIHPLVAGPAKSSIAALVNGTAQGLVRVRDTSEEVDADNSPEARVMRLRGYGNAICIPVAAAFVKAYMELAQIRMGK